MHWKKNYKAKRVLMSIKNIDYCIKFQKYVIGHHCEMDKLWAEGQNAAVGSLAWLG